MSNRDRGFEPGERDEDARAAAGSGEAGRGSGDSSTGSASPRASAGIGSPPRSFRGSFEGPRAGGAETPPGLAEVVHCVVTCVEQILRELPRGLSRFNAAHEQIKKARQILEEARAANEASSLRPRPASPGRASFEGSADPDARGI